MTASSDGSGLESALRALAEAQARADERFAAMATAQKLTEERFAELAAAQARSEERLVRVEERLAAVDERLVRVEERLAAVDERLEGLTVSVSQLTDQVADLSGWMWESRYQQRAPAYFTRILRRPQVLSAERLARILDEAIAAGRLSETDVEEIERADLICRGRRAHDGQPAYLVVEVSAGVGPSDVERAARRAGLLARTGIPALAAVAGQRITSRGRETAEQLGVWQVTDGTAIAPEC